ncbi:MAG: pitrilysin family protein [Patescibacteria group bacterium]|nr:pitrilysin family protein [Patescibacteria group bacterium]MDD5294649.1 pitrilysin family protein [Patescibacteria group bacterium]MDD5554493.1 pitrilysin family protein [Patescibacteria group bacterium]
MYKQKKLKNGLKLITVPMTGTKTITILVMVKTGSKYENKKNNGISHFLEHMFFKGTKKRPTTLAIAGELDKVGAEFNAFTSKEYTGYYVKVDSSKIKLAADIVSDMLLNSKFEEKEIEREKGVIIEEINMRHDNPLIHIEDVFEECLYGDSPAGWEVSGEKENVLKLKRQDLLNYLNSQYGVDSTIVCLAGNIAGGSEKLISRYFSRLKKADFKDKIKVKEKQAKPQIKIYYKKTDQANISLGVRGIPVGRKEEFILKVLSIILGGSMSSRLFTELRERSGLAYYVRTQAEFYTDSGYLTTQAGVPVKKIEEAVKIILDEYKKLKNILVSEKELKRTKDLIRGRSVIKLEASDDMAGWYAERAILSDKILSPEDFFKKVNGVKALDIKRVAKKIFVNKGLNLAIIGPFKDERRFKNILKF